MTILMAAFILTAFISDARRSLIPNALTISGALVGLIYHLVFDGWGGLLDSAIGCAVGFAMLLLLYMIGALGAGDVKLFAAVGAMMGAVFVWQSMIYSLIFAGVIGILLLVVRGKLRDTVKRMLFWLLSIITLSDVSFFKHTNKQELLQFPFMYAVLPGVTTAWYYSYV